MPQSPLQEAFLQELALTMKATQSRIESGGGLGHELSGLIHGLLVIFDGGSALADLGLISIVDEQGNAFDRNLHEIWPRYS